jgi:hypothetical protein
MIILGNISIASLKYKVVNTACATRIYHPVIYSEEIKFFKSVSSCTNEQVCDCTYTNSSQLYWYIMKIGPISVPIHTMDRVGTESTPDVDIYTLYIYFL